MPPPRASSADPPEQSPQQVAEAIRSFFAANPAAAVLEDGKPLFDMQSAQFELRDDRGHCTLQLWGEDRNLVRRVVAAVPRAGTLRLHTLRLGHKQTKLLELVANRERRTPSTTETTRIRFLPRLERLLQRHFPDWTPEGFRSSRDLEHSFGPAYARGTLLRGQHALAVIAVNADEPLPVIDAILTPGILWLQHCREASNGRRLFEGLVVILPRGRAALTASRIAWMNHDAARWLLLEHAEHDDDLTPVDPDEGGNLRTRLVRHPDPLGARDRFAPAVDAVLALIPPGQQLRVEQRLRSAAELAFLLHGLEFARARSVASATSFTRTLEITVGAGPNETPLTPASTAELRAVIAELFARRHPEAPDAARDPLFRAQPERWLESVLRADLAPLTRHLGPEPPQSPRPPAANLPDGNRSTHTSTPPDPDSRIIPRFDPRHVYAQVPAIAGARDRGLLDLLGVTADGRLAVLELKADEDPGLALQGLDYWIRVRHHHQTSPNNPQSEFQQQGYFAGLELSPADPRLYLVAPALRIHPATEIVLRYVSPRVEWHLLAVDERWRTRVRVVWRKQR